MSRKQNMVRYWIATVLLLASVVAAYTMPVMRYEGTGFISKLEIPLTIDNWQGKDVSNELNLDFDKNWNKFISEAKIIQYINKKGGQLLLIILDAGNFHHPNVCFTSAGFKIKELEDIEANVSGHSFSAHALYTEKGQNSNLSLYWIIIDKKIARNWIEQKLKQLYFSLFNRNRVGLMVRFDIPAKENTIEEARLIAIKFMNDLSQSLSREQAEYVFGQTKSNAVGE